MSKVLQAAQAFAFLFGEKPGVVAVSGGADSVALLRGLHEVGVPVVVGHFNHRLRGAESDADEAFVRELAGELGLACHVGTADVAVTAAEHRENLEATARRVRYEWLTRLTTATGGAWVVTGHTLDDHAETVLHRIIRGTGFRGLRGIPANRPLGDGVRLERPFLRQEVTRSDVLEYLTSRGQPYREDSSNSDQGFTRNRLRNEVMPVLREINPDVARSLMRLAAHADEVASSLEQTANKLAIQAELPRAGDILVFDARYFDPLDLSAMMGPGRVEELMRHTDDNLLREMFRGVWENEGWPLGRMTATHWQTVVDVARGQLPAADLPGGVHVRRVGAVVQLRRKP